MNRNDMQIIPQRIVEGKGLSLTKNDRNVHKLVSAFCKKSCIYQRHCLLPEKCGITIFALTSQERIFNGKIFFIHRKF